MTRSFGGIAEIYIIKTNANGDSLWAKTYGGALWDEAHSIQETADSGFIIAGNTTVTSGPGGPDTDIYLLKTDANGDSVWAQTYELNATEEYRDYGYSVQQTTDGGYIVVGETWYPGAPAWEIDVYLVKTYPNGDTMWTRTYDRAARTDKGQGVQQTEDGGYIIAGGTDSYKNGEQGDVWLVKTDGNGNHIWHQAYDGEGDDYGFLAWPTDDSGHMITATGNCGAGKMDYWLIKTDAEGNKLWDKTFGGTEDDELTLAQLTPDGGYILVGYTKSFGTGGKDIWLVKTDAEGNKVWDKTLGAPGDDHGSSVWPTADGGYIVLGYTDSSGAGGNDFWILKLSPQN